MVYTAVALQPLDLLYGMSAHSDGIQSRSMQK